MENVGMRTENNGVDFLYFKEVKKVTKALFVFPWKLRRLTQTLSTCKNLLDYCQRRIYAGITVEPVLYPCLLPQ